MPRLIECSNAPEDMTLFTNATVQSDCKQVTPPSNHSGHIESLNGLPPATFDILAAVFNLSAVSTPGTDSGLSFKECFGLVG